MKISLPSSNNNSTNANDNRQSSDNKSISPSSSPRSSPRPSPRPQTKREHAKSDNYLTVKHSNNQSSHKQEGSPSSQDGSLGNRSLTIDITPPPSTIDSSKSESSGSKEKKDTRTKKKSSWFNSFYPTYKSRSEDFKRLFKDVPDDERLVVDYSCALQKEILVQGRLYVTQNYLCFYANIFGWETNLTLKWKDVAAITKEKTAIVIPNAVLICTSTDKYFFTSFVAREKTYLMLFRVWQNALMDQPMSSQELWQWVHQSYGDELGLTSDDEDYNYIAPGSEEDKLSSRLPIDSFSEECAGVDKLSCDIDMDEDDLKLGSSVESATKRVATDNPLPTDVTDNSESDNEKPLKRNLSSNPLNTNPLLDPENVSISPSNLSVSNRSTPNRDVADNIAADASKCDEAEVKCTASHQGRVVLSDIFAIHIDQIFTLFFTNSKFYLDFHAARKSQDLTQTPWTHNPMDNTKSRVISLTMALSSMVGPKTAQVTETQTLLPCSKAGQLYSIDIESVNAGIPYADSFSVNLHICLQKVSDTQTSMTIIAQVKYKKSVWPFVRSMIEKNCWAGLEDFYSHLARLLRAESEESIPDVKRKSRRKRRMHSISRSINDDNIIPLVTGRKKSQSIGLFNSDVATMIVFAVLVVLLLLNVVLYCKLWSLEESPPYTLLDLHILQNPPKSHEEWIRLLQQQETLHSVEAQKWQRVLRTSIQLLKQAEESLNELQRSIHPTYTNKVLSIMKNNHDGGDATEQAASGKEGEL